MTLSPTSLTFQGEWKDVSTDTHKGILFTQTTQPLGLSETKVSSFIN